jgi:hypothetical protein
VVLLVTVFAVTVVVVIVAAPNRRVVWLPREERGGRRVRLAPLRRRVLRPWATVGDGGTFDDLVEFAAQTPRQVGQ